MAKAWVKCVNSAVHHFLVGSNPGGGGVPDILYIRRLGSFFFGSKFEFQYFLGS